MRRIVRFAGGAALATAATALAYACAPFGAEADVSDASGEGGPPDATTDGTDLPTTRDAAPEADAAAAARCAVFRPGATDGFVLAGSATLTADGVQLTLAKNTASITKTFETDRAITRSFVEINYRFTPSAGQWGTANTDFADFFAQYYGTTPAYQSSATTSFAFAGGAVDLDVWSAPNVFAGSTPAFLGLPAAGADLVLTAATTWSPDGSVQVVTDKPRTKIVATNTGAASRKLTLVIGGASSGSVPAVQLLVKSVCVALQ